ncbi:hypothetical protein, partial [Pseudomonas sp. PWP3-1]|uniref:hypothetical protein n=1 Tax=Pseudomonas sp. PWP3-1 TaxID=2804657 RepID=UPI003CF7B98F
CWGKSLLVTFGLFSKVTRRKGGTNTSRYPNNGYVLNPTQPQTARTSNFPHPNPRKLPHR